MVHGHWWLIDPWQALLYGLLGALLFELATIALRFGLGWTSSERTRALARITRGWRVHHGYPGLALLAIAPMLGFASGSPDAGAGLASGSALIALLMVPGWWGWLLSAGLALAVSDLLHHAVVLPVFAGGHEFDLKYPDV